MIQRKSFRELFGIQDAPETMTVKVLSDASNPFIPKTDSMYVFRKEFLRDVYAFLMSPGNDALYITGPTGSGKTSGIAQVASRLHWPVQQITAHGRMEFTDLVGFHALVSKTPGETPVMQFMYGPLATAMRNGHILLINEVDLMDPSELAGLNDILEGRPLVIAQNGGEIIQPHPLFRVVVTGNSVGSGDSTGLYQGVQMQNIAAMDRYRFVEVGYTDPEVEMKILSLACPRLNDQLTASMVKVANKIRYLFMGDGNDAHDQTINITMSTRTLVRWAKLAINFHPAPNALAIGLDQALLVRANAEEKAAINRIAKDVFGDLWK